MTSPVDQINYCNALLTLAPTAQWSLTNNDDYDTLSWYSPEIPVPTKAQCDAQIEILKMEQPLQACKEKASSLLFGTDWTTIPDVANPQTSNPYLMNQAEFMAYRNQLRQLAVNPVADPVWPTAPNAQWSS